MVNVIQIIHSFKPTAESVAIEMINKPNPLAASRFDLIILLEKAFHFLRGVKRN